jgi:hypothetical protein
MLSSFGALHLANEKKLIPSFFTLMLAQLYLFTLSYIAHALASDRALARSISPQSSTKPMTASNMAAVRMPGRPRSED